MSFIPPAAATVVQSTRFRCSGVQASSSHSVASWFPFDAMPGVDRGHTWLTSHMRLYTEAFRIRQVDSCFPLAALTYLILRPLIQLLLARHSTRACPRAFSSSWEVLIWGHDMLSKSRVSSSRGVPEPPFAARIRKNSLVLPESENVLNPGWCIQFRRPSTTHSQLTLPHIHVCLRACAPTCVSVSA